MWRRRTLSVSPARISKVLTRRRASRLLVLSMISALTLLWLHGSVPAPVRAMSASTSVQVVRNFGGRLTSAGTLIKVSPKVATAPGDTLVGIVEVRRITGLTMVTKHQRQQRQLLGQSRLGAQPKR